MDGSGENDTRGPPEAGQPPRNEKEKIRRILWTIVF